MFKRYKPFFRAGAMSTLAYKFNLLSWVVISAFQIACLFFLWKGVYSNSVGGINSVINGFTYKQMIVYVVFVNILNFVSFPNETMWEIEDEITKGTIAMSFVKPISYRLRFVATVLGMVGMSMLILGLPFFVVGYVVFSAVGFIEVPSVLTLVCNVLLFLVAQLLAVILYDTVDYICGVLCFYTTASWGLNQIKNVVVSFLSGTLLPLSFFPGAFGKIMQYSPFVGMSQNPILILLNQMSITEALQSVLLSLAWVVVLNVLAKFLFNKASKKVTVQGG